MGTRGRWYGKGVLFGLLIGCVVGCGDGEGGEPPLEEGVVYHPPTAQIRYSFYHYLPASALARSPVRILVEALSSPEGAQTYEQIDRYVRSTEIPRLKGECARYGYAYLVMVTPAYSEQSDEGAKLRSQQLARWVMFDNPWDQPEYAFYKRPDLVLNQVIDEFLTFLSSQGETPHPRVFLIGFANGGMWANRYALLHPGRVAAVAAGGAGAYMYPLAEREGHALAYPVGVADVSQLPGTSYCLATFKRIPHFIFAGADDTVPALDPVADPHCFAPEQASLVNALLGADQEERARRFSQYLQSIGMRCAYKAYSGVGHQWTREMINDSFAFFESVTTSTGGG